MPCRSPAILVICLATGPAAAQAPAAILSPADAYQAGCGGCHRRETSVLRAIPPGPEAQRRAWIERFMAGHPNERESLTPLIIEHLLARSGR